MRSPVFTQAGLYRFRPPADPAVAWCELDEAGDVVIFASEAEARSGEKPLVRMSQDWFSDIALERLGGSARRPPRWKRVLAALDARDATFAELESHPGWYVVEWYEPGHPTPDGDPWRQVFRPGQKIYGSKAMLKAVARRAAGKLAS